MCEAAVSYPDIDWQAALVIEPKHADASACDHGVTFDAQASRGLSAAEVRKRWPRGWGPCPKGCGWDGIAYASAEHYIAGDW